MQICTVKLSFCAAKRLVGFAGKCQYIHGYGHVVEASFAAKNDDTSEMVIDFYEIKNKLGNWLDEHWDHNILLHEQDKGIGDFLADKTGQKPFYFKGNPTAENISSYLKNVVCADLFPDADCVKIRIYDTSDAWVETIGTVADQAG